MVTATVGMRVKRTRRGCVPTYGTVVTVDEPDARSADAPGDRFVFVQWDSGVKCMCMERELSQVVREPKRA